MKYIAHLRRRHNTIVGCCPSCITCSTSIASGEEGSCDDDVPPAAALTPPSGPMGAHAHGGDKELVVAKGQGACMHRCIKKAYLFIAVYKSIELCLKIPLKSKLPDCSTY